MSATSTLSVARALPADYWALMKPRITLMVALTGMVGYVMAGSGSASASRSRLLASFLGTALVAAGASCLNMLLERRTDALMRRTANRPLPASRLSSSDALLFGSGLTSSGLLLLSLLTNPLAALVAAITWASYVLAYTPLKTRTSLATIVGAVPGALPPVIGWASAKNSLDPGALVLFAILFFWQIPHFLAIAWMYREDYARGGILMLPVLDPEGRITGRQAIANSLALTLVSLLPTAAGMAGLVYFAGALLLGLAITAVALRAALLRTPGSIRALFAASILYLAALCGLLLLNRT
jgi:protoheme IX farnesyltransferase